MIGQSLIQEDSAESQEGTYRMEEEEEEEEQAVLH